MRWEQFVGHQQQREWFRTALVKNRLATSFLFVGPEGIGKRTFARMLAKSLLCRGTAADQLEACGACEDCAQVDANTHPDLIEIAKPEGKSDLPLELLIGSPEKRMREGLCYEINLRPFSGRRKFAIVDDADSLNQAGANALLKTLEEPPPDSTLVLVGNNLQAQLPTIRSRCQTILFQPLSAEQLSQLLMRMQIATDIDQSLELAKSCEGSLTVAKQLSDPGLSEFRDALYGHLSTGAVQLVELPKSCGAIVDAAGKEAKPKRERMKQVLSMAAKLYRGVSLELSADTAHQVLTALPADQRLIAAIGHTANNWTSGLPGAVACWQTCLSAIEDVDRNANQASLLQFWATELALHSGR